VISEGGAVLILEELGHALKRGTRIYAELIGYGTTHDAYHITQPAPDGEQAEKAIRLALRDAAIQPGEVDYISAHGSATILNDKIETLVVKRILGTKANATLMSSIESMIGHPLGAASAIKIATSALALHHGIVPPTINYEHPDPECDLNYVPNESIQKELNVVLCNAFSFGGKNSILVLKKFLNGK
jgi:3-oxoacyl-[acyl-carrier-protein] synthase II